MSSMMGRRIWRVMRVPADKVACRLFPTSNRGFAAIVGILSDGALRAGFVVSLDTGDAKLVMRAVADELTGLNKRSMMFPWVMLSGSLSLAGFTRLIPSLLSPKKRATVSGGPHRIISSLCWLPTPFKLARRFRLS